MARLPDWQPGSKAKNGRGSILKPQLRRTPGLSVLALARGIIPAHEPVSNTSKLARREDKVSTTSSAPLDHLSLENHFRDLASQERALAESYEHLAALYKQKPQGLDPASARKMKNLYRRLAEIQRKAARAAQNLAEYHSGVVELMSHTPAVPKRSNPAFSSFGK